MVGTIVEQHDVIVHDTGFTMTVRSHVHDTHRKRRGPAPRIGILERLQSSVAVCFKFGLGSLHRLDLVMSHFGVKRKRTGLRART